MYRKVAGLWMTGAILEAIGPAALTTDETWGSPDGFLESQQPDVVHVHNMLPLVGPRGLAAARALRMEPPQRVTAS